MEGVLLKFLILQLRVIIEFEQREFVLFIRKQFSVLIQLLIGEFVVFRQFIVEQREFGVFQQLKTVITVKPVFLIQFGVLVQLQFGVQQLSLFVQQLLRVLFEFQFGEFQQLVSIVIVIVKFL